jgi:dTDP-4-amino-4,6-dideoxygalactose transaminase
MLSGCNIVKTPVVPEYMKSAWALYSVLTPDEHKRGEVQERLRAKEIPTAVYYIKPLHLQHAYDFLGYRQGDFPVTEDCSRRIFSLPFHPYLTENDIKAVVDCIKTSENA